MHRQLGNWRIALLGATGVVLSLASGWTTWEGMRNFTGEPLLALMVTFGVQGLMLVLAWLIGESFVMGFHEEDSGRGKAQARLELAVTVLLALIAGAFVLGLTGVAGDLDALGISTDRRQLTIGALAAAAAALIFMLRPYAVGARIIIRNAVLWVMFLACMAISVFFSFDSLFTAIFPAEERTRAAGIRATNQVAAIVSEIGKRLERARLAAADDLVKSASWLAYERNLASIAGLATEAADRIRAQASQTTERRSAELQALQERRATAQSTQAALAMRKAQLVEELSRGRSERPEAAQKTQEQLAIAGDLERRLEEQRAKTLAEEKGVEGSLHAGRGQLYRASRMDEQRLGGELDVARERLKSQEARLLGIDRRLATLQGELARIDGELAKLEGEIAGADQRIAAARSSGADGAAAFEATSAAADLRRALLAFRQSPSEARLTDLLDRCTLLRAAVMQAASTRERAAPECDPGRVRAAAAPAFGFARAVVSFAEQCAGSEKLAHAAGTDAMLAFGRRCLKESVLPAPDAAELGAKLAALDLSRDDKAHRFIVTWNAFSDGNRLAYLALALAVGIDGLIFMSGLFGAQVARTPERAIQEMRSIDIGGQQSSWVGREGSSAYEVAGPHDRGLLLEGSYRELPAPDDAGPDPRGKKIARARELLEANAVRNDGFRRLWRTLDAQSRETMFTSRPDLVATFIDSLEDSFRDDVPNEDDQQLLRLLRELHASWPAAAADA